jgi:hypothetical protein
MVDALLAADKELAGTAIWEAGNRIGERRLVWPVLIGGQLKGVNLNITAYPNSPPLQFGITLNVPPCVWRLDFEHPHAKHRNPLPDAERLGGYRINGSNYHAWADNRHLATAATLPKELECARALPANIQTFEAGLRWFCGETKIRIRNEQMIEFPERTGLI